jgi:outer membrane protein assembly factor BamB
MSEPNDLTLRTPLRLWPGVIAAVIVLTLRFILPLIAPQLSIYGILAAVAGMAVILLWWLLLSRAPWIERIGAIVVMILAVVAVWPLVHESISGGFMGRMLPIFLIPATVGPGFVAWAVATRGMSNRIRRISMVATIVLATLVWTLVRTDGVKGEAEAQLQWRWSMTPEQRLLAQGREELKPLAPSEAAAVPATPTETPATPAAPVPTATPADKSAPAVVAPAAATAADPVVVRAEWPGFRGPRRDNVVRGATIETDWTRTPPVELWRRPIGPGWSSFAVQGDLIYTQEQRGEEEIVSCYRRSSGEPVWRHSDAVRFYESNGGPGPRATPELHGGRVYTLGATGIVNALDARTGARIWSRNAATDTGAPMPGWGYTGSPLVHGDLVIVAASGRLAGYDIATGNPRWTQKTGGSGYSSPHLLNIGGMPQVLLLTGHGATSVSPADGTVLWDHQWEIGTAIVQPIVDVEGDVLFALGDAMGGQGIRRLSVTRDGAGWKVTERWTSRGLKPYFNDFVVHEGHAYGFDGTILAAIGLTDGERKWKGGRYGQGQLLLLPEQDLLLVLSEEGELVLISATPDKFTEIAKFKAIEGKTWNHPVLVGDVLLVRNGEEMAAFRLR